MLKQLPLSSRFEGKAGYGDSGFQFEVSLGEADKKGVAKKKKVFAHKC